MRNATRTSRAALSLSGPWLTNVTMGVVEKIKEIEHEMARTQKNKATEYVP